MVTVQQCSGEQPIFTCKAHVFHIDPKTKRSWISASNSAVPVSFFYDSSRALYRIISVEGTKAVINSTITPNMTFTKTSQKFGQWSDVRANTVYGLGFGSEGELNKFIEKFAEVKEATSRAGGGKANGGGGGTGTTPTTSANASPVTGRADKHNDNVEPQHFPHQNQNDAVNSNLLKTQLTLGNDSPKKTAIDKGPAPNPPLSGEAQLKYENDRLKLALAQSSANAKKWEVGEFFMLLTRTQLSLHQSKHFCSILHRTPSSQFHQPTGGEPVQPVAPQCCIHL